MKIHSYMLVAAMAATTLFAAFHPLQGRAEGEEFVYGALKYVPTSATTASISGVADTTATALDDNPETVPYNDTQLTVTGLTAKALSFNKKLKSFTYPAGCLKSGYQSLMGSDVMTTIVTGDKMTAIEDYSFYSMPKLSSVTLGKSVTSLGYGAMGYDYSLRTLKMLNPVPPKIAASAFISTPISNVKLYVPEGSVDAYSTAAVWKDFGSILEITGPQEPFEANGLKYLTTGSSTCELTGSATGKNPATLVVPDQVQYNGKTYKVTKISGSAFLEKGSTDNALTSVTIGANVTLIGDSAFMGCSMLQSLDMGDGVTKIGNNSFYSCSTLSNVKWSKNLASIGVGSFEITTALTEVELPSSMRTIGSRAFYESGIIHIKLNEGLTSIGTMAFCRCHSLKELRFPETVTRIATNTAFDCYVLGIVEFGSKTSFIDWYSFTSNNSLYRIIFHGATPPKADPQVFEDVKYGWKHADYNTCLLYVPEGSKEAYEKALTWKQFKNIIEGDYTPTGSYEVDLIGLSTNNHNTFIEVNKPVKKYLKVFNACPETVTKLSFTYTVDGGAKKKSSLAVDLSPLKNSKRDIDIPIDPISGEGTHHITISLDSVNGHANLSTRNAVEFDLVAYDIDGLRDAEAKSVDWMDGRTVSFCGVGSPIEHHRIAMHFKGEQFVGKEVVALEPSFFMGGQKNFKVWISSVLPSKANGQKIDYEAQTAVPEINDKVYTRLNTPVKVPAEGVWVGVEFDADKENTSGDWLSPCPMVRPDDKSTFLPKEAFMWSGDNGESWTDWTQYGYTSTIRVYLKGGFPQADMKPVKDIGTHSIIAGDTCQVELYVENNGIQEARSLTYSYEADGTKIERTVDFTTPLKASYLWQQRIQIPIDGFTSAGAKNINLSFTKVNGIANPSAKSTIPVTINVSETRLKHRVLMEEGTGLWCAYCPRGTVGMHELAKLYPDFIALAYHGGDELSTEADDIDIKFLGSSFPTCRLDRGENMDPLVGTDNSDFGILKDYKKALNQIANCVIDIDTKWDDGKENITVESTTTFASAEPTDRYTIAYVASLDSLTGSGVNWEQANAYKGKTDETNPYLKGVVDGTFNLDVYDHVAFAGNNKGVANSLPGKVEANTPYKHQFVINCSDYDNYDTTLAHKVKVVAFVIDQNGHVRNACQAVAGKSSIDESGIQANVIDAAGPVVYYDLMGRLVANPSHGIYIKRQGNKATKVMM